MSEKILLAVDGSERAFEAVSIVGTLIKDHPDLHLVIFHCVQQMSGLLPGELCGGLGASCALSATDQERLGRAVLEETNRRLHAAGFPENRTTFKVKKDSADPAQDILAEAESGRIQTIAVGRRGLNQLQTLLLGSVSTKVAQYARHHTVWIVDTPVYESPGVLVAMEGAPDVQALTAYLAKFLAPIPGVEFTLIHLVPPLPPTFWDDGHILDHAEQKDRRDYIEKWRSESRQKMRRLMSEGRDLLIERGVPEKNVTIVLQPMKEGIARDLLNEVEAKKHQLVVMGKRSFLEKKPFLMGSHANKILQNLKRAVLCLVDS
jgi:nucleotide-binding universal stress UspA family protein